LRKGGAEVKLPTTVRYAARIITELASAGACRSVSVRELGELQGISAKYLEHILKALKAAGLVYASSGAHGGYALARAPATITLRDLHESLVGSTAPVDCVDCPESCPRYETCPTRDSWVELRDAIQNVLERTTIQDLVERKQRKMASAAPMYYI
jgi:Rrf2 family protein